MKFPRGCVDNLSTLGDFQLRAMSPDRVPYFDRCGQDVSACTSHLLLNELVFDYIYEEPDNLFIVFLSKFYHDELGKPVKS